MRVLLVGPDLEENLSLRYLASSLRAAGHEPRIAAFDSAADARAVIAAAGNVDLVGLSMCYQIRAQEFLALAADLKRARPRQPIIAGGHYASCAASEIIEHHPDIDLIGVHECERTLARVASLPAWTEEEFAKIPGLVYRSGGKAVKAAPQAALANLDELPWPERSGPARLMAGVPTAYMMGSRGCLGACDYCCITTMHRMVAGKRFRQRSPENIADEMALLYRERGVRQFIFHDDNFLVPSVEHNLDRIDALDRAIRRRRLRHIALALKCRPGDVDRQVFLRLREMGLLRVFLGIESGSQAGLASIGRRQTVAQEHHALSLCEELGISTQYTIIMFHPEATLRSMREDLAFVDAHAGQPLSFCRAEIYAGTPLERRMRAESRAFGNYLAREYRYTDPMTLHVWNAAWSLLPRRCFAQDHLLGQIVRLDHQAHVLQHFYDGSDVDRLVADFTAFELEANRDTLAALRAVFALCEAHPDAASVAFRAGYAELREREESRCDFLLRRACAFREAIRDRSLGAMGLGRDRQGRADEPSLLDRLPRHAAAVFLAVGLMNCDSQNAVKSARDAGPDTTQAADSKPAADTSSFRDQGGMFEAPPPRMDAPFQPGPDLGPDLGSDAGPDAGADAGLADAKASDGTTGEAGVPDDGGTDARRDGFVDQGGMFEAPPPRMDARIPGTDTGDAPPPARDAVAYFDQGGMFEAPPPPMDAAIAKKD
jgi:anaerobic magnesium-protoporphyrin IX monomethyl ester cyclase